MAAEEQTVAEIVVHIVDQNHLWRHKRIRMLVGDGPVEGTASAKFVEIAAAAAAVAIAVAVPIAVLLAVAESLVAIFVAPSGQQASSDVYVQAIPDSRDPLSLCSLLLVLDTGTVA